MNYTMGYWDKKVRYRWSFTDNLITWLIGGKIGWITIAVAVVVGSSHLRKNTVTVLVVIKNTKKKEPRLLLFL